MPVLTYIQHGKKTYIEFEGTPKLSELLSENGLYITSHCGGRGVCKKCAVFASGDISDADEKERAAGVRLACRVLLFGDCVAEPIYNDSGATVVTDTRINSAPLDPDWRYGAAIDIGTTTVVLKLFDSTGACIGEEAALNPQRSISSDVMGRISAALNQKDELLKRQIHEAVSQMLLNVCKRAGIDFNSIDKTIITGNTAMLYLYCGVLPRSIAFSPFKADCRFGEYVGNNVFLAPCADAFIGGDVVCSVLSSGMYENKGTALLCDIGTNGEVVLCKNGQLFAVSAAAGPAFEGGEISCGCGCISGAVDRVTADNGEINVHTVDNASIAGICGTGLIDAVAAFLELGYIDKSGYASKELKLGTNGSSITLAQDDIRALQLAKSAVRAAIDILLLRTQTDIGEIDTFYLSGGFGKYIDLDSAVAIGLIPEKLAQKTELLGNSALSGAIEMLFDENNINKAKDIADNITVFNLSGEDDFYDSFIKNIDF